MLNSPSKRLTLGVGVGASLVVGTVVTYLSLGLTPGHPILRLPVWLGAAVALAGIAIAIAVAVLSKDVRFEITGQTLCYFEKDHLIQQFDLPRFRGSYDQETGNGDTTSQHLYLTPVDGGDPVKLDCSELPAYVFEAMFALLTQRGLQVETPAIQALHRE